MILCTIEKALHNKGFGVCICQILFSDCYGYKNLWGIIVGVLPNKFSQLLENY